MRWSWLSAVLVTVVAFQAGEASSAGAANVPDATATSSVVRDQSSGDEWVFAVDTAGAVEGWEWTPTTNAWTLLPLTGGAVAAAGTEPIAVLNTASGAPQPVGYIAVYYIGADGRMWSYQFTPSGGWSSDELPGVGAPPAPDTSPTVIYAPTAAGSDPAGFTAIYYAGVDGRMWNYNYTPAAGWNAYALPGGGAAPAADSSPQAVANLTDFGPNPKGFETVFYIAANGQMWNYNFTPANGWSAYALSGAGATPMAHASPAVEYAPAGTGPNPPGFAAVYYVGDDGQMWNYNFTTSTGWTAYALPNAGVTPAAGTSPSLVVDATQTGPNPPGFAAIYYVGDDGEIWNDNWTSASSWSSYAIGGSVASGPVTPVTVRDPNTGYTRIYFPGQSDEEDAFTYNPSWTLSQAFSLTAPTSRPATPTPTPVAVNPPVPSAHTHDHRKRVRVKIVMDWTWSFTASTLHRVSIRHFPRRGEISVRCRGRGCPSIARRANARHEPALLRSLAGLKFRVGNRLLITITVPHDITERTAMVIRSGLKPRGLLLN